MRAALPAVCALFAAAAFAAPPPYELAVDVPSVLGGAHVGPQQVERRAGSAYTAIVTLPSQFAIAALHRRADGVLLFSPIQPVVLSGTTFEPRDVVAYSVGAFSMFFDGSKAGVPADAGIDALFLESDGALVMSFDVPVKLGGIWRGRSSLLRYDGAWAQAWDAAAAGVPPFVNVVGADRLSSGELVVTFDIPVRIAGTLYKRGQLIGWNGASFEAVATDPSWPPSAQMRDFSFLPPSGSIAETLLVDKTASTDLTLTWGPSCAGSDTDFEVYEGDMSAGFANHVPALCSTLGASSIPLAPTDGNRYYLVVPRNAVSEGSYGTAVAGAPRPPSDSACLPPSVAACGGP